MTSGVLVYRCRRCGRIEREIKVRDVERTVYLAMKIVPIIQDWDEAYSPRMPHLCEPGRIGICELIGADVDEEAPDGVTPGCRPAKEHARP